MSVLSAAQLAVLATWTNTSTGKLERVGQASIPLAAPTQDDWQSLFGTLAESVEDLNTAITAADGNFADPVADITALKAVAAADRQDKQMRVVESDGLGQRSIYVFDSASSATADDVAIVAPTAGSGRWFMLSALPAPILPCINNSGSPITKGQPVAFAGYVSATGRVQVAAADADGSPPPAGAAFTALANGASGLMLLRGALTGLALDTSGAALGDAVYLAADGSLSLTPPTDTGLGAYVVGLVSAVSLTGGVFFFSPVALRAPGLVRGVATMGSAATTETVAVGAAYNGKRAQVSFAGDPGTASVLWAAPVTGGDLVIHVDAAPGADVDIMWSIIVEQ